MSLELTYCTDWRLETPHPPLLQPSPEPDCAAELGGGAGGVTYGRMPPCKVSVLLPCSLVPPGLGGLFFCLVFFEDGHASMLAVAAALPPDIRCRPLAHSSTLGDWFYCVFFFFISGGHQMENWWPKSDWGRGRLRPNESISSLGKHYSANVTSFIRAWRNIFFRLLSGWLSGWPACIFLAEVCDEHKLESWWCLQFKGHILYSFSYFYHSSPAEHPRTVKYDNSFFTPPRKQHI